MPRSSAFPRDPIEATAARIKYGLDGATYSRVAARLRAWRLGSAIYHSASELHRIIRESARYEPSGAFSADRQHESTFPSDRRAIALPK